VISSPFPEILVLPGKIASASTCFTPQARLQRVLIAASCRDCVVTEFRVGTKNVIAGPLSTVLFSADAGECDHDLSREAVARLRIQLEQLLSLQWNCGLSVPLTLCIRNEGREPVTLRAVAFGIPTGT